jgi:anti-sigma B factor antagonist
VGNTGGRLKETVKSLILDGGRIVIDPAGVDHLDSSALGALVGLKVSAINPAFLSCCESRI